MGAKLLEVNSIVKSYDGKRVVDGMDFQAEEGEILGFLGPNGAGKSTTIRLMLGMEEMDAGEILFDNQSMKANRTRILKEIGYVPQDIAVYHDRTAYENVKFFCSLYGFRGLDLRQRVKEALEFVQLWDVKEKKPSTFSGGMQRRLNIACAIAHRPRLLIMDEPTVGIDPQSRNYIMEAIRTMNERGTTVIYVSHYMEEIEALCNHIVIADHGSVIEDTSKEELHKRYKEKGYSSMEDIFLHLTGVDLRDLEVM